MNEHLPHAPQSRCSIAMFACLKASSHLAIVSFDMFHPRDMGLTRRDKYLRANVRLRKIWLSFGLLLHLDKVRGTIFSGLCRLPIFSRFRRLFEPISWVRGFKSESPILTTRLQILTVRAAKVRRHWPEAGWRGMSC